MLWLLPFLCSGAICWLNRDRIAAAAAPPRVAVRPTFGAGPFATSYFALPPAAAGYGSTPYGVGQLALPAASPSSTAPAASPFAFGSDPYLQPLQSPAPSPTLQTPAPIAVLRCAIDGCPVRPEPRAWDDATLGRMPGSFTAPRGFPVYVLSYGPVGWANVLVNHPDEGAIEGWIEARFLTEAPIESASPGSSASPASPGTSTTSSTTTTAGTSEAMARHLEFVQRRGPGRSPPPPPRRRVKQRA